MWYTTKVGPYVENRANKVLIHMSDDLDSYQAPDQFLDYGYTLVKYPIRFVVRVMVRVRFRVRVKV